MMKQETENEMNSVVLNPQDTQRKKPHNSNDDDMKIIDLRSINRPQDGFSTEIGSSDANKIKEAIEHAQQKNIPPPPTRTSTVVKKRKQQQQPIINTVAGYRVSKALPDTSRIGWTAFSSIINPGGSLGILATEKKPTDEQQQQYSVDWQDTGVVFLIGLGFWSMIRLGGGIVVFIIGLFFISSYCKLNIRRFHKQATDDIQREFAKIALESSDFEKVAWLNNLTQKFWLIFEPLISAFVVENIDTYIVDYLPGFLDSVRLTTFTLGSKPFTVESVKTFTDTAPNIVCMDMVASFVPNDTTGMTRDQIEKKQSPKVVLNIRLGKGFVGTALSVLVEDMSFKGRIRLKLEFMSKFPHVRVVDVCFMEKPIFDYVLKPIGGETFGFDVNSIPGLQGFIREQTHAILGPLMYYPNVFSFDLEKFFSGELDISQANGVLAITVHSCSKIITSESNLNTFIRFYLNKAQELEKTSIIESTRSPVWNETKFILLHDLESLLTMELRTTSNSKKAGKKLARAVLNLKDMTAENQYTLENQQLPMLRRGKFVTNLRSDIKYFPVSKPIENPDGTFLEAEPSNSGILRITIHECKNLGSNKVNPYALIKVNGVDRFETPTFKRTANPKFERPFEFLVLDMQEVYIRVMIIDRIDFAGDTSLGAWNSYLTDILKYQEEKEYWWTLRKKGKEINARIRLSVQWKPVVMAGLATMGGIDIYSPPVGVMRFSIWSAKHVGKSSPYVRIKSGKQVRARTEILDNTEVPEWGESHYVPVHSLHEDLVLEVMGWTSGSKDKSLGSTIFRVADLLEERHNEHQDVWYVAKQPKLDREDGLRAGDNVRGKLVYTVEFYPTMTLPERDQPETPAPATNEQTAATTTAQEDVPAIQIDPPIETPRVDLHDLPIRYTPDDLIDLSSYGSGVLTIKIHEIKAPIVYECYCRIMIDSLTAQHRTKTVKGRLLAVNEVMDAFIKDAGFSRVAIELKPPETSEKDDDRLAYWVDSSDHIIRNIQRRARSKRPQDLRDMLILKDDDEGEWYNLINPMGGTAQIRLSFGYAPLLNYEINPDESLENQGVLTVTLLNAKKLKAVDKSGTSDPYVKFIIDGELVHKSSTVKKNLNPVWKNETFQVPIISRVTASFRIEVFDWNQIAGDVPLGSGGITIRGDMVESFSAHECEISLDATGSVRVRLKWEPQLLLRKKQSTTFMGTTRKTTTKLGTTAFNFSQPVKNTSTSTSMQSAEAAPQKETVEEAVAPKQQQQQQEFVKPVHGKLTVHVLEARGLKGDAEKLNPIVHLHIGKYQKFKTNKIKKSTTPTWNETFSYTLNGTTVHHIDVKVKDAHTFSTKDIGDASISLWQVLQPPKTNSMDMWVALEPEGSGEVHLKLEYIM